MRLIFIIGIYYILKNKFRKIKNTLNKVKNKVGVKSTNIIKDNVDEVESVHYHTIDLNDSLSITQYSNELLKEFGKTSELIMSINRKAFCFKLKS